MGESRDKQHAKPDKRVKKDCWEGSKERVSLWLSNLGARASDSETGWGPRMQGSRCPGTADARVDNQGTNPNG